jgi:hypothetical protein
VLLTDGVVEFYSRSNFCAALLSVVERQLLASPAKLRICPFCFPYFVTQSFGAYVLGIQCLLGGLTLFSLYDNTLSFL